MRDCYPKLDPPRLPLSQASETSCLGVALVTHRPSLSRVTLLALKQQPERRLRVAEFTNPPLYVSSSHPAQHFSQCVVCFLQSTRLHSTSLSLRGDLMPVSEVGALSTVLCDRGSTPVVDVQELPRSRCSGTSSKSMCRNFLDVQEPPSGTFSFARDFLVGSY